MPCAIGMGIGIPFRISVGGGWNPASAWFSASEQGVWFDPSDLSTMYQDSAGTTPVTAVEQPVGLILDKSGRGNHATQTTSTARPTLRNLYNRLVATATLSTQNVTTSAAGYQLRFSGAGSITLSGTAAGTYNAGTHSITCTAGTLTLTVSGTVTNADLLLTIDALLPYQWVVTTTNYDSDPAKFPLYLAFDGSDDSLATGSVDFSGTDKMTVVAGVSKSSNVGTVVEASVDANLNNGAFRLGSGASYDSSAASWTLWARGTQTAFADTPTTYGAPRKDVLAAQTNIAGPSAILRVNGAVAVTSTTTQGTGNYGTHILYIGRKGGTTSSLNGRIHQLIIRGAASADIAQAESFTATRTGVTL